MAEFQKSGDSQEVVAVRAYNSLLLPLYRTERCVVGGSEMDAYL